MEIMFNPSNLKGLIEKSELNDARVAEAIGINVLTLRHALSGDAEYMPSFETLVKLADLFAVPLDFIAGRCDEETANGILKDYGKYYMALRRAPFETYLKAGRMPTRGTTRGTGRIEAPWPYNFFDAVFGIVCNPEDTRRTIVDGDREADVLMALKTLTPKEELALLSYYRDGMNMAAIGEMPEMNVTGTRIQQIIDKALRKLRHPSRAKVLLYGSEQSRREGLIAEKARELAEKELELDAYERKLSGRKVKLIAMEREIAERSGDFEKVNLLDEEASTINMPVNYGMTIREMDLSVRAYNCLIRANINDLEDLISCVEEGRLSRIRNLGYRTAEEILDKVFELTGQKYKVSF